MPSSAALREAELARYDVLDEPAAREVGRDLQALVELTAEICDVSTAAVNLITGSTQCQVATVGFEASTSAREDSLCAAVLDAPGPVVVPDARLDDRFRDNPFVTGELGRVRFYASAPLVSDRGVPIGRLCVFDDLPRNLTGKQARALAMLAERVVDLLELRRRGRELEESLGELIRTRDELHRSNARLGFFAAQVSHDLRSPLTAMLLNTEAAAQEPGVAADPAAAALLATALDSGRRMSVLIDEVLAFAQVGAALRLVEVDAGEVMEAVRRDLAPMIGEHHASVCVEPLPRLVCDEQALYSVLLNLVSNAVKFSAPGEPPRVEVRAVRAGDPEDRWRVEVVDNGVGIPEEARAEVFLPFERGPTAAGAAAGPAAGAAAGPAAGAAAGASGPGDGGHDRPGHGIGLATSKRIVEAHGGRIGLDSAPGGGTLAWFELPD